MPPHMQRLWRSGICPFLVPAAFYEEGGLLRIRLLAEGLTHMAFYEAACPEGIQDSFCLLLSSLASAALAFAELQRWLADPAWIDLSPEHLFYDRDAGQSLLTFQNERDSRSFAVRFLELCRGLGGSGALVASRLEDVCASAVLEEKGTAAFLSAWQRQILEGSVPFNE